MFAPPQFGPEIISTWIEVVDHFQCRWSKLSSFKIIRPLMLVIKTGKQVYWIQIISIGLHRESNFRNLFLISGAFPLKSGFLQKWIINQPLPWGTWTAPWQMIDLVFFHWIWCEQWIILIYRYIYEPLSNGSLNHLKVKLIWNVFELTWRPLNCFSLLQSLKAVTRTTITWTQKKLVILVLFSFGTFYFVFAISLCTFLVWKEVQGDRWSSSQLFTFSAIIYYWCYNNEPK